MYEKLNSALTSLKKIISCESCDLASCCCDTGYVYLLPFEVNYYKQKSFPLVEYDGIYFFKKDNGNCIFFSKRNKTCEIYQDRPIICRMFPIDLSFKNDQLIWNFFSQCPYISGNARLSNYRELGKIVSLFERHLNNEIILQYKKTLLVYSKLEPKFLYQKKYVHFRNLKPSCFPIN